MVRVLSRKWLGPGRRLDRRVTVPQRNGCGRAFIAPLGERVLDQTAERTGMVSFAETRRREDSEIFVYGFRKVLTDK